MGRAIRFGPAGSTLSPALSPAQPHNCSNFHLVHHPPSVLILSHVCTTDVSALLEAHSLAHPGGGACGCLFVGARPIVRVTGNDETVSQGKSNSTPCLTSQDRIAGILGKCWRRRYDTDRTSGVDQGCSESDFHLSQDNCKVLYVLQVLQHVQI